MKVPAFTVHSMFGQTTIRQKSGDWKMLLNGDGDCGQVYVYADSDFRPTYQLTFAGKDDRWAAVLVALSRRNGLYTTTFAARDIDNALHGLFQQAETAAEEPATEIPALSL